MHKTAYFDKCLYHVRFLTQDIGHFCHPRNVHSEPFHLIPMFLTHAFSLQHPLPPALPRHLLFFSFFLLNHSLLLPALRLDIHAMIQYIVFMLACFT